MKTCDACIFYICVCIDKQDLIKRAEEYTKGRYKWTEKHEEIYKKLSDDDGVCFIKCKRVACDQKACRNYVSFAEWKKKEMRKNVREGLFLPEI